jgi:hypothetical protein
MFFSKFFDKKPSEQPKPKWTALDSLLLSVHRENTRIENMHAYVFQLHEAAPDKKVYINPQQFAQLCVEFYTNQLYTDETKEWYRDPNARIHAALLINIAAVEYNGKQFYVYRTDC